MKVFGIGPSRTAGTSLEVALERLGFRTYHHVNFKHFYSLVKKDMSLNYVIVDRFDAVIDLPAALNYKELDKKYPDAKFILTIRDKESWLESMYRLHKHQRWFIAWMPRVLAMDKAMWGQIQYDRENLSKKYDAHLTEVKKYFSRRKNKLLVLNIVAGDGYEKLCPFLEREVIAEPFPHKNKGYHTILNLQKNS